MSLFNRLTTWVSGQLLKSADLNNEFNNLVNGLNNLDSATTTWDNVKAATITATTPINIASGGTNSGTALTNGEIIVSSGGALVENSATKINSTGDVLYGGYIQSSGSTTRQGSGNQIYAELYVSGSTGVVEAFNPGASTFQSLLVRGSSVSVSNGSTTFGNFQAASSGGTQLLGTTANDNAASGIVGEYVSSTISTPAGGTNATWANITSISLTAGDWDVSMGFQANLNGSTASGDSQFAISVNSGTTTSDQVIPINQISVLPPTSTADSGGSIACYRLSLSGTTTVYAKGRLNFSAGTMQFRGSIHARRVR